MPSENISSSILTVAASVIGVGVLTEVVSNAVIKCFKIPIGAPTIIPLRTFDFMKHIGIVLTTFRDKPSTLVDGLDGNPVIYGYSCRSLFETSLIVIKNGALAHKSLNILTLPIHHTSFKLIMERHADNIDILELDEHFREIVIDQAAEEKIKNCDVIVITHLFGRHFDLRKLIALKKKYNKVLIVDSVTAGRRLQSMINT